MKLDAVTFEDLRAMLAYERWYVQTHHGVDRLEKAKTKIAKLEAELLRRTEQKAPA